MSITLRVATVRVQRPGRTVFTGKAIDAGGQLVDARAFYVVTSTRAVLVETVEPGQWWTVNGTVISRVVDADGFKMTEHTIAAEVASLERLSGEHLVSYRVFDAAGLEVVQMALAGRAAKRMQEATGKPAATIASFIRASKRDDSNHPRVVVIDEASMLDIVSMSAVCERLNGSVRLVLLGDPSQLMPVGPGLVLHALTVVTDIPHVELKSVKRYGGEILVAALAVRAGKWPALSNDVEMPISFLPCSTDEGLLADLAVELYSLDPENTQILVSKKEGAGGAKRINEEAQRRHAASNPAVLTAECESTGLHVGDPVLCTRNLWDHGLQNGSMGVIIRLADPPSYRADEESNVDGSTIAWVQWDDSVTRPLLTSQLDDITLGYAITVHKAQGSQWRRVIIPVIKNRMLDRSLLYTAITRAQTQVILIGDEDAARQAVEAAPRSTFRQVALDLTTRKMLRYASTPSGEGIQTP